MRGPPERLGEAAMPSPGLPGSLLWGELGDALGTRGSLPEWVECGSGCPSLDGGQKATFFLWDGSGGLRHG